jgi:hypothetical protein
MNQNTDTKNLNPYVKYQNTEEWVILSRLLDELINNQDIELKTAPEYVIGYLVEKLRNKDFKEESKNFRQVLEHPKKSANL